MSDFDEDIAEMRQVELFAPGWLERLAREIAEEDAIRKEVDAEVRKRMAARGV